MALQGRLRGMPNLASKTSITHNSSFCKKILSSIAWRGRMDLEKLHNLTEYKAEVEWPLLVNLKLIHSRSMTEREWKLENDIVDELKVVQNFGVVKNYVSSFPQM